MSQKSILFLLFIVFSTSLFHAQKSDQINEISNLSIGKRIDFYSKTLKENRVLNIYLPENYDKNSSAKYPVIYLLDGSIDEDFIHIAGIVQFGSFSWIEMLPKSIVVGISNVDRKRDFTYPTQNKLDQKDFPTSGRSKKFISFIKNELQPLIRQNYSTNKTSTIIGQSLGGLLATEILFKHPETFDNYIIVSPSLWWDDNSLLKTKPKKFDTKKSIYIAVGKEGDIMENSAKQLRKTLEENKNDSTKFFFNFFEKQSHGDALHLAVYNAFTLIFKPEE
ncbi:alpha/beta hydrolase-fold protein [Mesonia sp.]|uniref:alpha/beta hydrolase n=1 Tax=Mesonia sp. TaxID=1960830 RepID=UPI001773956B|nr:alpha/beta hydrolase-fold protein [Mesonia sp.]HIB36857.1 alpha/beta hydrolase [Mesonia sp.]